jgi:hypothetical protein
MDIQRTQANLEDEVWGHYFLEIAILVEFFQWLGTNRVDVEGDRQQSDDAITGAVHISAR